MCVLKNYKQKTTKFYSRFLGKKKNYNNPQKIQKKP